MIFDSVLISLELLLRYAYGEKVDLMEHLLYCGVTVCSPMMMIEILPNQLFANSIFNALNFLNDSNKLSVPIILVIRVSGWRNQKII